MQLKPNTNYLKEIYDNNLDYAREMLELFVQISPPEIMEMKNLLENDSIEDFARLAHKIKPTFSMVGLPQITILMQDLERSAKLGDLKQTKILFEQNQLFIEEGFDWVKSEYKKLNR